MGGAAQSLYLVWRKTGQDPYRLYNMLGDDYRPLDGEGEPRRPLYPSRVVAFLIACGRQAWEDDVKLAGGQISSRVGRGVS
jgi:hypothetical protein